MKHELALAKAKANIDTHFDVSGEWRNQLGSRMRLTVNGAKLTGSYDSAVSGKGGRVVGDLVGFVRGDLISFVVKWEAAAITSWVGQVVNDRGDDVIETLWHMTVNVPESAEPTSMWQSVFAGTDRFVRPR